LKPKVLVSEKIAAIGLELLRKTCDVVTPWAEGRGVDEDQMREVDAVIVRLFRIGSDELSRCERLRVIAKHGVGLDNIDVSGATARRIPVVFTPAANANAVAEHAVALMLALARQVVPAAEAVRRGRFADRSCFEGVEVSGKTLGVVGLGRIGSRVAEIAARGLAMRVLGFDPVLKPETYHGPATLVASIETLLAASDFITLHVPLSPQTHRMINAKTLALLKPTCRIINTSRGAVIDEPALAAALETGRIAGAALDVFESEPVPADHPLCRAPRALLTPHISSSTAESLDRMSLDAAQGVLDVLRGQKPKYPVNREVFA
jgi:D-3-phosphoglycerate dehydrogenase